MTTDTDRIHVADHGTIIRLTITDDGSAVDLTSATELLMYFRKPDGTDFTKTGTKTNPPGTDGKIQYTVEDTAPADPILDQKGTWEVQARVELPSGLWHSDVVSFEVFENITD